MTTELTTAVSKGLNWKNLVTTMVIVVIVIVVLGIVMKQTVTLYDENGKPVQQGEIKFGFKKLKKTSKV